MQQRLFWSFSALILAFLLSDYACLGLITCESYGEPCLIGECNNTVLCEPSERHCFTLWGNGSDGVDVKKKGCFTHNKLECRDDHQCLGTPRITGQITLFFCCCSHNLCNVNFTLASSDQPTSKPTGSGVKGPVSVGSDYVKPTKGVQRKQENLKTLLYTIVPIFGLALLLGFCLFMYHHQKGFRHLQTEEEPLNLASPPPREIAKLPIQCIEVISQGQYGVTVWKAKFCIETVAVKVFPLHEKTAWTNEKDFYKFCNLAHENLVRFIAEEEHVESQYNGKFTKYWLITEYHEHGSLSDYLKQHCLSWAELCQLAKSMANGLAYLHTEVPGNAYKPCIAHRDIKSKNILVKRDLTCCISDFGLALKFEEAESPGETHGQVGTKRYMAPEVLEGAISFTRESFLRIDMYACGLVLWELASRCTAADGPVGDYRLPFEEEVGLHPSLEDMQQVVVQKKMRPKFWEDWKNHLGLASLIQTIEECWDQDAEARLTSQCVAQRIAHFAGYTTLGNIEQVPTVTSVINNTTTPSRESSL